MALHQLLSCFCISYQILAERVEFATVLISLISSMVNVTLVNFGKRYADYLMVIFDQWPKLCIGLDVEAYIQILKGIYLLRMYLKKYVFQ